MLSNSVLVDSAGRAVVNPGVLPASVSELAGVTFTSQLPIGSPQGAANLVRSTPGVQVDCLYLGTCRVYALEVALVAAATELSNFSIQVFDSATGPGAGELPVWSAWIEAGSTAAIVKALPIPSALGLYFSAGVWVALSKSATVYADPTLSSFTASTIIAQGIVGDLNV